MLLLSSLLRSSNLGRLASLSLDSSSECDSIDNGDDCLNDCGDDYAIDFVDDCGNDCGDDFGHDCHID